MAAYRSSVFINCPFDEDYKSLFDAIVFAVHDCGFVARCAFEVDDGAQVRIDKILDIIEACRFGVHDLSRTELDGDTGLPRFNMPLELGLFLGARRFGNKGQREKRALILDRERFRYRAFCSNIAGQDPRAHDGEVRRAIVLVRDWLRNSMKNSIPSGSMIFDRYSRFLVDLPDLCAEENLDVGHLIYNDYTTLVEGWLKANPWG